MVKCFHCEEEFETRVGNYKLVVSDRPYINIYFHKVCYNKINDIYSYFEGKNEKKWYNYISERSGNERKRRKTK